MLSLPDTTAVLLMGLVQHHSLARIEACTPVIMRHQMQLYQSYLQGRTYTIESNIDSSAKKETVLDVLTDYPSHPEVFSSIHSSRVITRDENEAHVLQVRRP